MIASYSNEKSEARIAEAAMEVDSNSSSLTTNEVCVSNFCRPTSEKLVLNYTFWYAANLIFPGSSGVKENSEGARRLKIYKDKLLKRKLRMKFGSQQIATDNT